MRNISLNIEILKRYVFNFVLNRFNIIPLKFYLTFLMRFVDLWVNYSPEDSREKKEYLLKNPLERMRLSKELHTMKEDNTWKKRADTWDNSTIRWGRGE